MAPSLNRSTPPSPSGTPKHPQSAYTMISKKISERLDAIHIDPAHKVKEVSKVTNMCRHPGVRALLGIALYHPQNLNHGRMFVSDVIGEEDAYNLDEFHAGGKFEIGVDPNTHLPRWPTEFFEIDYNDIAVFDHEQVLKLAHNTGTSIKMLSKYLNKDSLHSAVLHRMGDRPQAEKKVDYGAALKGERIGTISRALRILASIDKDIWPSGKVVSDIAKETDYGFFKAMPSQAHYDALEYFISPKDLLALSRQAPLPQFQPHNIKSAKAGDFALAKYFNHLVPNEVSEKTLKERVFADLDESNISSFDFKQRKKQLEENHSAFVDLFSCHAHYPKLAVIKGSQERSYKLMCMDSEQVRDLIEAFDKLEDTGKSFIPEFDNI